MEGLGGKSLENDGGGEDLRQELGGGAVGAEKDVGGDSLASIFLEGGGDGGVAASPVGEKKGDILLAESSLNIAVRKSEALVDLAGKAPGGGEVDEDGTTEGELAGDFLFGPGGVVGGGGVEGTGGGSFENEGGEKESEEDEGEAASAERGGGWKGVLAASVEEKTERESDGAEQGGKNGGGTGKAVGHPSEPKDGGEHGDGENFFKRVHPRPRLRQEGEKVRRKGEEKYGQSKAEGEKGKN